MWLLWTYSLEAAQAKGFLEDLPGGVAGKSELPTQEKNNIVDKSEHPTTKDADFGTPCTSWHPLHPLHFISTFGTPCPWHLLCLPQCQTYTPLGACAWAVARKHCERLINMQSRREKNGGARDGGWIDPFCLPLQAATPRETSMEEDGYGPGNSLDGRCPNTSEYQTGGACYKKALPS